MAAMSLTDRMAALRMREGVGLDDERPQHTTTEANSSILYIHHSSPDRTLVLATSILLSQQRTLFVLRRSRTRAVLCGCDGERFETRSGPSGMWATLSGAGTSTRNVTSRRSAKPHLSGARVRDRWQLAATCDPEPAPRLQICRPWVSTLDDRGLAAACCAFERRVAQALGNDVR